MEFIEIRGARENNLQNVSLDIPKRQISIFTGVSGSGKSSIVFDTIASEARRQLNETFSTFIRNFLPRYAQPDADVVDHLTMAIVVDQKRMGGGSHSTVGTVTDIFSVLRVLFSRVGEPYVGPANFFSFNDPSGSCPECSGLGRKLSVNMDRFVDMSQSLNQGALKLPEYAVDSWDWNIALQTGLFDADKPLEQFSEAELNALFYSKPIKVEMQMGGKKMNMTFEGLVDKFVRKYILRDVKTLSERTQKAIEPFLGMGPCTLCHGARLNQAVLNCRINGYNIAELAAMEVGELLKVLSEFDVPAGQQIVDSLCKRIESVVNIGLDYITLSRETDTLSGGESQRIKMVKHLNSSLVDVTYIFDEPSVGLHPRDVHRLNELLIQLRDKGNTILVVEHDPDVIKIADHIVDVGPRAGRDGGHVVYQGDYAGLTQADTLTGRFLQRDIPLNDRPREPQGWLPIHNATIHNLQNVSVNIPKAVLTVVTGVAGSGKSSLINYTFMQQYPESIRIDQSAVGISSRSNAATYTGLLDELRKAFAKANNVSASLFSFNSQGACPNCQGLGVTYADMAIFDEVKLPCEVCGGKRFKDEVLNYHLHGLNISEVLELSVAQALELFTAKEMRRRLQSLYDVGLGYLTLGQPLNTLSGGECQRLKLASELHKQGSIYILDEPTTGLHMSDIGLLMQVINRLVDSGNSVIAIEHNLDVIKQADWLIDLGPEGGRRGGQVMYEGPPQGIIAAEHSLTGQYLREHLHG
jgi:excinuclease UvrABC ATPase subunit